ncbi:MAG: ATP-grasp domain-containing protein [Mycoplasmoidaceae bacterium]|nr:MAG: ATP-grasp domain-containing protein [Mycoplasmoidaceae bacterium]
MAIKKNAVVVLNPGDRCSRMLDYYKKYNFTPIVLRVQEGETKEIANDINETIKQIKKRIKPLVVIFDECSMDIAIEKLSKYNVVAVIPYEETTIYGDMLASKLGINGNDTKTSVTRKSKYLLNELLQQNKIRSIKSRIMTKTETVDTILKDFDLPIVLKPTYGSSSVNVFCIFTKEELQHKLSIFKNMSKQESTIMGDIIIQEFIEGKEYVANFISYQNKHILTDVWEYEKFKSDMGVQLYKRTNLVKKLSPLHQKIVKYSLSVLNAMKYTVGPTHLEIKVDKKGPVLIEANLRIMGGIVFEHEPMVDTKYTTTEFGLLTYMNSPIVKSYFTKTRTYNPNSYYVTAYTLFSNKEYVVKKVIDLNSMKKMFPSFIKWKLYVEPNKKLIKTINYITEPAEIEFASKSSVQLEKDCKKLSEIEKNNIETLFIPKK